MKTLTLHSSGQATLECISLAWKSACRLIRRLCGLHTADRAHNPSFKRTGYRLPLNSALGGSAYIRTSPNPSFKRTGYRLPLNSVLCGALIIKDLHRSHPADARFSRVHRGYQYKLCRDYRYLHIDFFQEMCCEADSVSVSVSQQHCAENMSPHNPPLQRTADAAA